MVVLAEAEARETSLLLELEAGAVGSLGACYHRDCYDEASGQSDS